MLILGNMSLSNIKRRGPESRLVPINGFSQAILERCPRLKAKPLARPGRAQSPPRLAIRPICLPPDLAFKTGQPRDHLYQILNHDFAPISEIDWITLVVSFSCAHNSFGAILYVQEFSGRFT